MSNLEMRPIELQVTRNYSSSDTRQVPAAGAKAVLLRQGATVAQAVVGHYGIDVEVGVFSTGALQVHDLVTVNHQTGSLLRVVAVDGGGESLTLRNIHASQADVSLAPGQRLVISVGPRGWS